MWGVRERELQLLEQEATTRRSIAAANAEAARKLQLANAEAAHQLELASATHAGEMARVRNRVATPAVPNYRQMAPGFERMAARRAASVARQRAGGTRKNRR